MMKSEKNESYWSNKCLYFLLFGGLGIYFPYLAIFYETLNFSKSQIGILCMIPNFCAFFVAPFISMIGDALHAHYEVMMICLIGSTLVILTYLLTSSFTTLALIVLLGSMLRSPLYPQVDALTMSTLTDKSKYGEIRAWGAIGFGIFSLIGGILSSDDSSSTSSTTEKSSSHSSSNTSSFRSVFYIHAIMLFCTGFILLYFVNKIQLDDLLTRLKQQRSNFLITSSPEVATTVNTLRLNNEEELQSSTIVDSQQKIPIKETETKKKRSVLSALIQVFQEHPQVGIFSLIVFFSGFGEGVIDSYLFLRLKSLGGSGLVMGISRFITCASEVPMFQIAGKLQEKYGVWPMLAVTQFAFVIRFTYYSTLTIPWLVLPCEILHGTLREVGSIGETLGATCCEP
jgi:hypothetical protein